MEIFFLFVIDNSLHRMVHYQEMTGNGEVQTRLALLRQKGWTFANIARNIGQATVTIESWNAGIRSPANLQSVLASLDELATRKRIPKKKAYGQSRRSRGGNNE